MKYLLMALGLAIGLGSLNVGANLENSRACGNTSPTLDLRRIGYNQGLNDLLDGDKANCDLVGGLGNFLRTTFSPTIPPKAAATELGVSEQTIELLRNGQTFVEEGSCTFRLERNVIIKCCPPDSTCQEIIIEGRGEEVDCDDIGRILGPIDPPMRFGAGFCSELFIRGHPLVFSNIELRKDGATYAKLAQNPNRLGRFVPINGGRGKSGMYELHFDYTLFNGKKLHISEPIYMGGKPTFWEILRRIFSKKEAVQPWQTAQTSY